MPALVTMRMNYIWPCDYLPPKNIMIVRKMLMQAGTAPSIFREFDFVAISQCNTCVDAMCLIKRDENDPDTATLQHFWSDKQSALIELIEYLKIDFEYTSLVCMVDSKPSKHNLSANDLRLLGFELDTSSKQQRFVYNHIPT